jgi:DNA (cytosine-5)-methyltransferase 1
VAGLTFVSLYSGCGGLDLGFARAGLQPVWANDIDPYAVETYNKISKAEDPQWWDAAQLFEGHSAVAGDVLNLLRELKSGMADVVIGGPPCFPAETLVLTDRGHVSIAEVRTGDLVLTHRGRWRRVLATGSKDADTVIVRGRGATIEATAEHPFWARRIGRTWNNGRRSYEQVWGDPEWLPAAGLAHRGWAIASACEPLAVPGVPGWKHGMGADFWWLVGRWLGDGWVRRRNARTPAKALPRVPRNRAAPAACIRCGRPARRNKRYPWLATVSCSPACHNAIKWSRRTTPTGSSAVICCDFAEIAEVEQLMQAIGLAPKVRRERTVARLTVYSNAFADWLTGNFGAGAAAKRLPGWVFGMAAEHRAALLAGYVSADGHTRAGTGQTGATTTSKALAIGLMNLVTGLGCTPTLYFVPRPAEHVIEGRLVSQRSWWQVRWHDSKTRHVRRTDDHLWTLVREVKPGRSGVQVYNLEVEEDNTYTADGIVVHNCQGFSVAGRMDPNDPRSRHVFNFLGVVARVRPRAFVMENVAALARNQRWAGIIAQLAQTAGEDYDTRLVVLNASHWGVPQARERMFLVGLPKGHGGITLPAAPTRDAPPSVGDALRGLPPAGQPGNASMCTAKITMAKIPVLRLSPFAGMLFNGQGRPIDLNRPAPTLPATMGGNRTPIIDLDQLERNATPWVVGYHRRLTVERQPPLDRLPVQARLRRLTVDEAAALQTFPSGMQWSGPQSARFRQIGNAVPPVLAWHVAQAVRKALDSGS